jgi:hypothetical protein
MTLVRDPNQFNPGYQILQRTEDMSLPTPGRKPAPLVMAEEPVKGSWTQDNNWGYALDMRSGWPLQNDNTLMSVVQNPAFRGVTRGRGCMLSRVDNLVSGNFTPLLSIQAKITIGAGGLSQNIFVDWGPGTTLNLPASVMTVEAVVNGDNDSGFGTARIGSYLRVMFSNELLPKEGYNTLTTREDWNSNILRFLPEFTKGFMFANINMAPTDEIRFYGNDPAAPLASFLVSDMLAQPAGTVFWLPSRVTHYALNFGPQPIESFFSWVLNI